VLSRTGTRGTLISSPHAKSNYDRWLDGKERDWGIRKGGRRGCLGSCVYIKFEGRGSGRESGGGCVLFESVH
jgi:hypothetical protein